MERFKCPCCGFLALGEAPPGTFVICNVCRWEDDNVQYDNPDFSGGANEPSLNEARENYRSFGANSKRDLPRARPPNDDEIS